MDNNSKAIKYAERQMRRLASPVVREKLGERTAMEIIGRLWVLTNSRDIDPEAIMVGVNRVNQMLGLKHDEVQP